MRILDAGCGAGRNSEYLMRCGALMSEPIPPKYVGESGVLWQCTALKSSRSEPLNRTWASHSLIAAILQPVLFVVFLFSWWR